MADEAAPPRTFAEVGDRTGSQCHRCGADATHAARLTVAKLGQTTRGGSRNVAWHKTQLCEECAVALFLQVRKAMR